MKGKNYVNLKTPAKIGFLGYIGDVQGCGTIRIMYPFMLLNHFRDNKNKVFCHTTFLSQYIPIPGFYKNFTFVTFQRSATKDHLQSILHFKNQIKKTRRLPLLYEIDDMLIDIPEWNYAHDYYKKNEDTVKQIMSEVDALTVSTNKLKEVYSDYNKNITVIPNHLPKFIWGDIYPKHEYYDPKEKVRILWPGSQNHFHVPRIHKERGIKGGDFGDEFIQFIKKTLDKYQWVFMGSMPPELETHKDKIEFHPWENIFNYPRSMKNIEADIGIAPLKQIEFNECKSNIKALEFVASGAAGIYTKIEPYKNLTMQANTDTDMINMIDDLASDVTKRANVYRKDHDIIQPQLFWEENNNIRKFINSHLRLFNQTLPKK